MTDYQLHYLLNEGMQRNLKRHIKQAMGKSIRKSRSGPYSRSEHHIKHPSNPFITWFQSERSKILQCLQEQNKNITNQLEARWKSMSKEEKAPFYYEARKAKRQYKKKYPSYEFKPRQKMRSTQPTSETVKKPEENKVERTTSNGRKEEVMRRCLAELEMLMNNPSPSKQRSKEDVMSRCMTELEKLMKSPSPTQKSCSGHMPTKSSSGIEKKKDTKEGVMSRCMAELEQLMNRPPQKENEVCETSKLRKDEVLRRVRDELIAKISAEQTPQHPSFMYMGYPSHTPYNSPCFPSPGYSYSLPFYGSSGYGFSVDQNEQYLQQVYTPAFFQEATELEDSQFFNSHYH